MSSDPPHRRSRLEERAEVEVLAANLDKLKSIRRKMKDILARSEARAHSVEEAVAPIDNNTRQNDIYVSNINALLESIDGLYTRADDIDLEAIAKGPRQADLRKYLTAVHKMAAAHEDMQNSQFKALQPMIKDSKNKLRTANIQLEDYFREVLQEESKPIEVLYYMTKSLKYPTFTPELATVLADIHRQSGEITTLLSAQIKDGADTVGTYSEQRGNYLLKSLENLSTAAISTSKPKGSDSIYVAGSCGIGHFVEGIEGMLICEYENIITVFPDSLHQHLYSTTTRPIIREFGRTIAKLNEHIKANMVTDCSLAFEIIDVVKRMFTTALGQRLGVLPLAFQMASTVTREMMNAINPVRETAQVALVQIIADAVTRGSSFVALSVEVMTLSLGDDIMKRVRAITPFIEAVGSCLRSMGDGGWNKRGGKKAGGTGNSPPILFDTGVDTSILFQHYFKDVVEALLGSLRVKAQSFSSKSPTLVSLFEANNIATIERAIRSSDLRQYLEPAIGDQIQKWYKQALTPYLALWRTCSFLLLDKTYTNRGDGNTSTKGQVKVMKDNISDFYVQFDRLIGKYRGYKLEKEVKAYIFYDVEQMIVPLYCRFYDHHFGKDLNAKHLHYTPDKIKADVRTLS